MCVASANPVNAIHGQPASAAPAPAPLITQHIFNILHVGHAGSLIRGKAVLLTSIPSNSNNALVQPGHRSKLALTSLADEEAAVISSPDHPGEYFGTVDSPSQ